jgi:G3E family GTPase
VTLPFTVIGGYLGAGKTTLVNRLLSNAEGRRVVVLVNDFGDIAVDAALIEADEGDTISFANGCVCCSLADGFAAALGRLRERPDRFDHVVVEVSGVGDPRSVAQWGRTPGFELDGVVVLADAVGIQQQLADPYVGETVAAQLAAADLVVLTKLDLVGEIDAETARSSIGEHSDAPVLSGPIGFDAVVSLPSAAARMSGANDGHATHLTRSVAAARPIDRVALDAFLATRPDSVVRVKGVVRLVGEEAPVVVQVVGRRVEVTPASPGQAEAGAALIAVAIPDSSEDELDAWVGALMRSEAGGV